MVVHPIGIESLSKYFSVSIRLEAVVRGQEHEECFTDLRSITDLLDQLLTVLRDRHAVNAVRRMWLNPD